MSIISKIKTTLWFIFRPRYWVQYLELAKRKINQGYNKQIQSNLAISWAEKNALDYAEAWEALGMKGDIIGLDKSLLEEAKKLAAKYDGSMGGPGHIDFIYNAVRILNAKHVVETGVAYGWSSLAILAGFLENNDCQLCSVDMSYPKRNNDNFVGIVVPERYHKNWKIIDRPDITGLPKALKLIGGQIDLCHYDSDKSIEGRSFAYPILWKSLRSGGLFISDDIADNLCFAEFVKNTGAPFCVVKVKGKQYMGAIRKP